MSRRPKKTKILDPGEEVSLEFLNECTNLATADKNRFLQSATNWSEDSRNKVLAAVKRRYGSSPDERGELGHLIKCLKEVPKFAKAAADKVRNRKIARELSQENRKADSRMSQNHPQGDLIGSTPTIGYKSPGQKKHWGTPRKRRG